MKAHETGTQAQGSGKDEKKVMMKQKAAEAETSHSPKKGKLDEEDPNGQRKKSTKEIKAEFEKFCKETSRYLTIKQMREILEANGQDSSGDDDAVVPRCQDVLFYGAIDECQMCGGKLEQSGGTYTCTRDFSEWSFCPYIIISPPRKEEPIVLPSFVQDSAVADLLKKHRDVKSDRPSQESVSIDKLFKGMMICLAGFLSQTREYWKNRIEKYGGKVAHSIIGANCLVVSPAEREQGGSSKLAEAMKKGIPILREAWLRDSIEKMVSQPLDAYDVARDLAVYGRKIPLYQHDSSEEALETIMAELKVYGKRGVHKDTKLQGQGGQIFKKDGLLYNCAFARSDEGRGVNEFSIMQLIALPENRLYMYCKVGRIGDEANGGELLEWKDSYAAVKEFTSLFQETTGCMFLPWERQKLFLKKKQKMFPIDIADGVEVRHGGLGLTQLGVAASHCKLEPKVANLMKILCSQEIYRYALTEMGLDFPEIPLGMVTDTHLKKCEEFIVEFVHKLKPIKKLEQKDGALWSDFSQRMFTLMPSTRPYIFRDSSDIADHCMAAFETIRDINAASRLIGDMSSEGTLGDPLFEQYKKLGCSISPIEKDSDDYKMVAKYLYKTYEPVVLGEISYGVTIDDVFAVDLSAGPSLDEIMKLPNNVLLWCGTRSSNLLRHLAKGFLPAVCYLPVPGYMFGKAIVCTDAAAEAARYGYTAVDRPEGFLILAVASLGEDVTELTNPPADATSLEEKKKGVIGLGKKKTDESEHFTWNGDIKVPCGRLIPSEHKDSPLEYNEYAVYDPQKVCARFLVAVKYEEKGVEYDAADE